jgi:hypothetical protein
VATALTLALAVLAGQRMKGRTLTPRLIAVDTAEDHDHRQQQHGNSR